MAIKTWPPNVLAGYNEGKPCGSNLCCILNPSLILKLKMYSLCVMFLQFWYPLNILIKLILKRIVGVNALDECTSVRIDNNYCIIYNCLPISDICLLLRLPSVEH